MYVIGTAGHVDHGKSTLTLALTGINPDRLEEEQRREMTIDLGFAWLDLPDGERIGIVDVPGHRDFIENMLAGVGGIDAAVLVIAADEGVMPQTREHLAILDLLAVPAGLIALTKIDLIRDPEWLELVQIDIMETVQGTVLEGQPIIPVSAHTGAGLDELVSALSDMLKQLAPRIDQQSPRLPVDRVFTISGFGVVVTGTLTGGSLHTGQEVEIQPPAVRARIRGLQSHEESVEQAQPGQRVAVNLRGVEKNQIARGHVLGLPGAWHPTILLDAWLRHLPGAQRPLEHNDQIKLFIGAAEIMGHVRVLDRDRVLPGDEAWIQLRLDDPIVAAYGDHYIIRRPSPPETIGGGIVLDTAPGRRWKRKDPNVIERFEILLDGNPVSIALLYAARQPSPLRSETLGLAGHQLAQAHESGALFAADDSGWVIHTRSWQRLVERTRHILARFHSSEPLRFGMPRDALRQRLRLSPEVFDVVENWLASEEFIALEHGDTIRLSGHEVRLSAAQQDAVHRLWDAFERSPYTPPTYAQACEITDEAIINGLIERGELVRLSTDVILTPDVLAEWVAFARSQLENGQPLTVATLRDHFQTTRRYALDFLERLDALGITRRQGDERILGSARWNRLL